MEDGNFGKQHLINVIDSRIDITQSNSAIIRELRHINNIALWKASEFRSWLLFYLIPILKGLLKEEYLIHFAMLGKATYFLLDHKVTLDDINEAHRLLMLYTYFFQEYFGEEQMRYNIHCMHNIRCKVL